MNYDKQELKPVTEWDGNPRWMFVWNHDPKEAAVRFVCKREHGFWLARRYSGAGEKLHLYDFAAEIPRTQTQLVNELCNNFETVFFDTVCRMRELQKAYFTERSPSLLTKSKAAEKTVDRLIAQQVQKSAGQQDLF